MKVLHINCFFRVSALHAVMLSYYDKDKYENMVFSTGGQKDGACKKNGVQKVLARVKRWGADRLRFPLFLYAQQKKLAQAQQRFAAAHVDIIHAYTLLNDGYCAMRFSQRNGNIPFVVAVRGTDINYDFRHKGMRALGLRVMQAASKIFFLSEASRQRVFDCCVPPELKDALFAKTLVVPNGIDRFWLDSAGQRTRAAGSKQPSVRLMYVGRVDKNKNILTTQQAMRLLREKGFETTLTLVGGVDDEQEYQRVMRDAHTTHFDNMPKEELINVYRAHDVFVMPSFSETFGLVYAEAMSQGLPVIYTKGQGFDAQFPEGEVGYHVHANSPEEICAAVEKIMQDYAAFSQRCAKASQRFNWQKIVENYCALYQQLVQPKKSAVEQAK